MGPQGGARLSDPRIARRLIDWPVEGSSMRRPPVQVCKGQGRLVHTVKHPRATNAGTRPKSLLENSVTFVTFGRSRHQPDFIMF